ncbi:MAG TPA: helix-turn-helix domain-containing protein [Bacteroidales bacterium]|nr:helix-turn-helix domain-containing protein [Bacteroidales bacterium]
MPDQNIPDNEFLKSISEIILNNITDERFGVSELARESGMSRSTLLRKIKAVSGLSVSQYIRQIRLKEAMNILKQSSFTVSEVSYKVGFSSTSYFIKCFRDFYGYPPGEAGNREDIIVEKETGNRLKRKNLVLGTVIILSAITLAAIIFIVFKPVFQVNRELEKSIAVLPFRNESNDSSNIYLVNGLLESIITDLQQIKDLRVVSRTSVEKYRNTAKLISEVAKELNVNYLIEGSGQKAGSRIMLNIQLVEGPGDKQLWAKQYRRDVKDIFSLQIDLARDIAGSIKAIITPDEAKRIEKPPTDNLVAYDYFMKGLDLFYKGTGEGVEESVTYFEKATEHDNKFARAFADLAIAYYMLDEPRADKKYTELIKVNADRALSLDDQLAQSLIAKALYYMDTGQNEQAVPYLEKALKYNPNSATVINSLSDFYARYSPDSEKYLQYALKGIRLDIASYDSATTSFIYMHLSNAFIQSGFVDEAEFYINRSLDYNPKNLYSEYIKAYILYAKNGNLDRTRDLLVRALEKDTTRLDILQEVAKICYYMRDFKSAYRYYKNFTDIIENQKLNIYEAEDVKIAFVFKQMGLKEKAREYLNKFKDYCDRDQSIYKHVNLALYYSYKGNSTAALEQMKLFSKEDKYHYWTVLFLKKEPILDNIRNLPEFKSIYSEMEKKFRENHEHIAATLKKENLL